MSEFSPDGYERTPRGVARAARHWFAREFDKHEAAIAPQPGAKPQDPIEQAVRAFSSPQIPNEWWQIANQTVHRLRNLLLRGELHADYFDNYGPHTVPRQFAKFRSARLARFWKQRRSLMKVRTRVHESVAKCPKVMFPRETA